MCSLLLWGQQQPGTTTMPGWSLCCECRTTRVLLPALQLCAGHIRVKNNRNILLKNMLDCAVGTVSWFLLG